MPDRPFVSIDPATGEFLARYEPHPPDRVGADLDRAVAAFPGWRDTALGARAGVLRSVADRLASDREHLARLATAEMGKPLPEALAEVDKCAWACRHFAERAAEYLTDVVMPSDAAESYVSFHPIGTVLAIMPWNFPYWQVFR
ncbi:MAG: aldehyde dehydrogenase family protein, partial [Mycobacteriales bacterium]